MGSRKQGELAPLMERMLLRSQLYIAICPYLCIVGSSLLSRYVQKQPSIPLKLSDFNSIHEKS